MNVCAFTAECMDANVHAFVYGWINNYDDNVYIEP